MIVLNHAIHNRWMEPYLQSADMLQVEVYRYFSMHWGPIRVPFFFVIAGIFTVSQLRKLGITSFSLIRIKRILLPFLLAVLTYVYVIVTIRMHQDISAVWDVGNYTKYILDGFYGFSYLWFLYVLIIYSAVSVTLYYAFRNLESISNFFKFVSSMIYSSRYSFILIFILIEAFKLIFFSLGETWVPDALPFLPTILLLRNLSYFAIGCLAALNFQKFYKCLNIPLTELFLLICLYALIGFHGHVMGNKYSFIAFSFISNALPLVILLSVFARFCDARKGVTSGIVSCTYTIYLIHMPVICAVDIVLLRLGMASIAVYWIVLFVSYPLSLLASIFIRRAQPVHVLFGAKPLNNLGYAFK